MARATRKAQAKPVEAASSPSAAPDALSPELLDYARGLASASTDIVLQHRDLYKGTPRGDLASQEAAKRGR